MGVEQGDVVRAGYDIKTKIILYGANPELINIGNRTVLRSGDGQAMDILSSLVAGMKSNFNYVPFSRALSSPNFPRGLLTSDVVKLGLLPREMNVVNEFLGDLSSRYIGEIKPVSELALGEKNEYEEDPKLKAMFILISFGLAKAAECLLEYNLYDFELDRKKPPALYHLEEVLIELKNLYEFYFTGANPEVALKPTRELYDEYAADAAMLRQNQSESGIEDTYEIKTVEGMRNGLSRIINTLSM